MKLSQAVDAMPGKIAKWLKTFGRSGRAPAGRAADPERGAAPDSREATLMPAAGARITTVSRVYLIIALFITLIFGLVWFSQFQMDVFMAIRVYVGGEGLWAKAQKDAVRRLEHYAVSRDEADYRAYRSLIQVTLGDRMMRLELQKEKPDMGVALAGFVQGRNHPDDFEVAAWFFRRFRQLAYMSKAIEHWTEGDRLIAELNSAAETLHAETASGRATPETVRSFIARLDDINRRVTVEEDLFSSTLAEAARWANDVFRKLTYAIALLFVVLGIVLARPIIARIRATENALVENEERLRSIFEHVDDIIFTLASDGTFSSISPSSERMIGWSPHELISHPFPLFIQPDDLPRMQEMFMKAQAGESQPVFQVRILTKGGGYVESETMFNLVHRGGSVVIIGIARDVTERKRNEQALARLQRSQEQILNSVGEGIHGIDLEGNIIFENPAGLTMLGWVTQEIVGRSSHATMHHTRADGSPYPPSECHVYATLHDGATRHIEDEVFWRKDGTSFPVAYTCTPMKNEAGEIKGAIISFRDITERKRMEDQLNASLAEKKVLVRSLNELATHDGLTGLYNHRAFYAQLEDELARARRFERPVPLLMLDIDHFKTVNDTYGHLAGDAVLKGLGELLTRQARAIDRVCRYGGEEITVILPETDLDTAANAAERLRVAVEAQPFNIDAGSPLRITVSIGVASWPAHADSAQALVAAADAALYAAKEGGRNRVIRYEPAPGRLAAGG